MKITRHHHGHYGLTNRSNERISLSNRFWNKRLYRAPDNLALIIKEITPTPTLTPTPTSSCNSINLVGVNANTSGDSVTKTSAGGWDGSAYSTETYTDPVSVTFKTSTNDSYLMGGFSYNPTANSETYTNTTYGLYIQPGFLEIYEGGGQVNVPGSISRLANDLWKVDYDGINVKYYQNGNLIYTSSNSVTQPLHVFFALLTPEVVVTNICARSIAPTPTPTATPTPTPTPTPPVFGSSGFQWMTMNSITESTASGIGQNNITVDITQTGGGMFTLNGMHAAYLFPPEYGVPTSGNQIANIQAGVFTAVFSSPVTDALVAFASVGQADGAVPVLVLDENGNPKPFTVIWDSTSTVPNTQTTYQNPVGAGPEFQYTQFIGEEGFNIIRIDGTMSSVTFNYTVSENYCTVCFGFVDQNV